MKRVTSSDSLAEAGHLKNLLEQAGIECFIRNEQLSGGIGEIPFLECAPELWVLDDARAADAARLIEAAKAPAENTTSWRCAECGELNEGQFAACWRCGAEDGAG